MLCTVWILLFNQIVTSHSASSFSSREDRIYFPGQLESESEVAALQMARLSVPAEPPQGLTAFFSFLLTIDFQVRDAEEGITRVGDVVHQRTPVSLARATVTDL